MFNRFGRKTHRTVDPGTERFVFWTRIVHECPWSRSLWCTGVVVRHGFVTGNKTNSSIKHAMTLKTIDKTVSAALRTSRTQKRTDTQKNRQLAQPQGETTEIENDTNQMFHRLLAVFHDQQQVCDRARDRNGRQHAPFRAGCRTRSQEKRVEGWRATFTVLPSTAHLFHHPKFGQKALSIPGLFDAIGQAEILGAASRAEMA